jgi:putative oxidoreductase
VVVLFHCALRLSGVVLLSSGLLHAWQPYYFSHSVAAYDVVPALLIRIAAAVVPYFQIVVGFCLAVGIVTCPARWFAVVLFGSFVILQAKVLLLGEEISCGCFGFGSDPVSLKTISIPTTLLVVTAISLFFPPPKQDAADDETGVSASPGEAGH